MVSRLRERELGVRRQWPHAAPVCKHQRSADCRGGAKVPLGTDLEHCLTSVAVHLGSRNRQDELQPKSGSVRGPFPAELSLRLGNRQIVDACKPALHEAIGGELPILVPVGAIPLAGVVMKLILETHSDAIASEGPELLSQSVVEFARPFAPQ